MTVQGHGYDDNVGAPAFRNVIINGGMSVAQRNTSVASLSAGSGYNTADRWSSVYVGGTWTQSVENDAPTGSGHRKSLKMLCTAAKSTLVTSDRVIIQQNIEGQNMQHFAKGTSSAKSFTISFWVKSNVTGTYICELVDNDNARGISQAYTISASGVWEKKTLTYAADTTGVLDNDNGLSFFPRFWLAAGPDFTSSPLNTSWSGSANLATGQVNLASAINNYWQVTGVQLEAGTIATPFEFEPFETTLRKCQRYYQLINGMVGLAGSTTNVDMTVQFPVEMRSAPTQGLAGPFRITDTAADFIQSSANLLYTNLTTTRHARFIMGNFSGLTTHRPCTSRQDTPAAILNAEL